MVLSSLLFFVILDSLFTFTKFQGDALEFGKCKHPIQNNKNNNDDKVSLANLGPSRYTSTVTVDVYLEVPKLAKSFVTFVTFHTDTRNLKY